MWRKGMDISNEEIIQVVNLLDLERTISDEDIDEDLNQIGLNSLEFVKMVLLLEDYFKIKNGEEILFDLSKKLTIRKIVKRLKALKIEE